MTEYAALLRGVTPMNAKMAEIRKACEAVGFENVRTVLASGNVLFRAPAASDEAIEREVEAAFQAHLARPFLTIVRRVDALEQLLASDPFRAFRLKPGSKRVVTFLREQPREKLKLPIVNEGARILAMKDREVFTAYVVQSRAAVFMSLLEKTFGKEQTTRSWDTVAKLAGKRLAPH